MPVRRKHLWIFSLSGCLGLLAGDHPPFVPMSPPSSLSRGSRTLAEEFPHFHFIHAPLYTLVTDQSADEVEMTLRVLHELRHQFERHFAALLDTSLAPTDIEVIFFGHEANFRRYARRTAPALADSAGFFAHSNHRLVLLNQLGTVRYRQFQNRLAAQEQKLRVSHEPQASQQLAAWRSQVTLEARRLTVQLIRHEGAHQLFAAYGLPPAAPWLSEGLAQYCEPAVMGERHPVLADRLVKFHRTGQLLPLDELLTHDAPAGFLALAPAQIEVAYAQSWGLVYRLMQPDYRPAFENLLRTGTVDSRALRQTFPDLDREWPSFLDRL